MPFDKFTLDIDNCYLLQVVSKVKSVIDNILSIQYCQS